MELLSKLGNFSETQKFAGEFTEKEKLGMLSNDQDVANRQKKTRDLANYAEGSESEREDEDIYSHYMNEMNKAKQQKAKDFQQMSKE